MVMGGHIKGFHYGQNDRFITFYKPLLLGPWWYKNSSNRLKQFDFQIPGPAFHRQHRLHTKKNNIKHFPRWQCGCVHGTSGV